MLLLLLVVLLTWMLSWTSWMHGMLLGPTATSNQHSLAAGLLLAVCLLALVLLVPWRWTLVMSWMGCLSSSRVRGWLAGWLCAGCNAVVSSAGRHADATFTQHWWLCNRLLWLCSRLLWLCSILAWLQLPSLSPSGLP
jgi:hypothetical protein